MNITKAAKRVEEFMETDVRCITPDQPLVEAITTLADGHVHGLPVVEEHGRRVVGVISNSDVLEALSEMTGDTSRDELLEQTTVKDIMSGTPATIPRTATLDEAAKHMLYRDVHRLIVTSEGDLAGVISQSDIVRALATGKI